MIVRYLVACDICDAPHTLRIAVGHDSSQRHSFQCRNCGETVEVEMKVDYQNVTTQLVPIRNCRRADKEGAIVNLSSMHVIPDELQGRDRVFPGMMELNRIMREDPSCYREMEAAGRPASEVMAEWERIGRPAPGLSHEWEFVKRIWSLTVNGRSDVCDDYITKNHARYRFEERPSPREVIFAFCGMLSKRQGEATFGAFRRQWEIALRMNAAEVEKLRAYLVDVHLANFIENALPVVSQFMDNYSEFTQVAVYHYRGVNIPEDFTPSSFGFEHVKQFYGNGFELLSMMLVLPACLNNVVQGCAYDTFETMSLAKYLESDKAGRHVCFAKNADLAVISGCINNQIRNGSHHGDMRFNPGSGQIVYRPNRNGGLKYIRYTDYLTLSLSMVETVCGLLATGLVLEQVGMQSE